MQDQKRASYVSLLKDQPLHLEGFNSKLLFLGVQLEAKCKGRLFRFFPNPESDLFYI